MDGTQSLATAGDAHNRGPGQGMTMLGSPPAPSTCGRPAPSRRCGVTAAQGFSSPLQHELPAQHGRQDPPHPSANNQNQNPPSAPLPQTVIKKKTHKRTLKLVKAVRSHKEKQVSRQLPYLRGQFSLLGCPQPNPTVQRAAGRSHAIWPKGTQLNRSASQAKLQTSVFQINLTFTILWCRLPFYPRFLRIKQSGSSTCCQTLHLP